MTIIGVVTNNGLSQSITAQSTNGWYIALSKFEVSNISIGSRLSLNTSRTRSTIDYGTVFHIAPISSKIAQSSQLLQVNCTIPPNQNGNLVTDVTEVYLYGESPQFDVPSTSIRIHTDVTAPNTIDLPATFVSMLVDGNSIIFKQNGASNLTGSGLDYDDPTGVLPAHSGTPVNAVYYVKKVNSTRIALYSDESLTTQVVFTSGGSGTHKICMEYLFAIGQPSTPIQYDPTGAVILRLLFNLQNIDVNTVFQFPYTQATEIYDHNHDPNAHPDIQTAMNEGGLYVVGGTVVFVYKGQSFVRGTSSEYHSSVTDKKPVYYDSGTSLYRLAQADGSEASKFLGFYFEEDNSIRVHGIIDVGHAFNVNDEVYLSPSVAGGLTTTPSQVKIGRALSGGKLLVSPLSAGVEVTGLDELSDVSITTPIDNQILRYNASLGEWVNVNPDVVTSSNTIINIQQLEYQNTLLSNNYNNMYYDLSAHGSLIHVGSGTGYNSVNRNYVVNSGDTLTSGNLLAVSPGGSFTTFRVAANVQTPANMTVHYSLNGTSGWTSINLNTNYTIAAFSTFYLRFTFNTSVNEFYSFAFMYDQNSVTTPTTLYLDDLNDVEITTPSNNNIIVYNTDTQKWENKSIDFVQSNTVINLKQVEYQNILVKNNYNTVNYDLLYQNNLTHTGTGTGYDSSNDGYNVLNGDELVTGNLLQGDLGVPYDEFMVHAESENGLFTVQYSVDGTTWIPTTLDTDITPASPFSALYLKFIFTGTDFFNSYGVFYDKNVSTTPSTIDLDNLNDVTITTPSDNQVLTYSGGLWINAALPSGVSSIDDLSDVTISSVSNGQVLQRVGGVWVNSDFSIDELSDVVITTPLDNQVLQYSGGNWINATLSAGVSGLNDLTDVTITTPLDGHYLKHNGSGWVNVPLPDSSTTAKGIIEIATQTEVDAGIDNTRAVTPLTLANYAGLGGGGGNSLLYVNTEDFTKSGTTEGSVVPTTGVGSLTIPADYFTEGKTLKVTLVGEYANGGNAKYDLALKLGATTLLTLTEQYGSTIKTEFYVTCVTEGLSGSLHVVGTGHGGDNFGDSDIHPIPAQSDISSIDLTQSYTLDVTSTGGSGTPTWDIYYFSVEDISTGGSGGGATTLDGLTDVVVTTPASGDLLLYDGTKWIAGNKDPHFFKVPAIPDSRFNYDNSTGADVSLSYSDTFEYFACLNTVPVDNRSIVVRKNIYGSGVFSGHKAFLSGIYRVMTLNNNVYAFYYTSPNSYIMHVCPVDGNIAGTPGDWTSYDLPLGTYCLGYGDGKYWVFSSSGNNIRGLTFDGSSFTEVVSFNIGGYTGYPYTGTSNVVNENGLYLNGKHYSFSGVLIKEFSHPFSSAVRYFATKNSFYIGYIEGDVDYRCINYTKVD